MLISLIQIGVRLRFLIEDNNRDNTMNTINAYYEYSIDVQPNMTLVYYEHTETHK
jgi:hypothetical protein